MIIDDNFWQNKKVLITGHTGFKGSWLTLLLKNLSSKVIGLSLKPETPISLYEEAKISNIIDKSFINDIRDFQVLRDVTEDTQPDIIFHMAAQPLVRKSYEIPIDTWNTNVIGTLHLLESLRSIKTKCAVIIITTDKVYQNKEWTYGYRENDRLGGKDPYSSSKAAAELVIESWRNSYCGNLKHQFSNIGIASVRAGNVIGGGDWAIDRLIPDIFRAKYQKNTINIRNPYSKRPWQHVLDPLFGYMTLAKKLYQEEDIYSSSFCSSFNIGPNIDSNKSVKDVISEISKYININCNFSEKVEDLYESKLLHLNTDKISNCLNWKPVWDFDKTIEATASWYRNYYEDNTSALKLCESDIDKFFS